MPTMTVRDPSGTDESRSYRDIVNAHRFPVAKVAAGKDALHAEATVRVARLAELYRTPELLTNEVRGAAGNGFAAIETRRGQRPGVSTSPIDLADVWLDHLALLVTAPSDGR